MAAPAAVHHGSIESLPFPRHPRPHAHAQTCTHAHAHRDIARKSTKGKRESMPTALAPYRARPRRCNRRLVSHHDAPPDEVVGHAHVCSSTAAPTRPSPHCHTPRHHCARPSVHAAMAHACPLFSRASLLCVLPRQPQLTTARCAPRLASAPRTAACCVTDQTSTRPVDQHQSRSRSRSRSRCHR